MQSSRTNEIFSYFESLFGKNPETELDYTTDLELLTAICLSAQCTDKRVNHVTKQLFKRYKSVEDYANADIRELEKIIYSTGFYHNKAKNLVGMARRIISEHNGKIPEDMDDLTKLPGVGRKTASVFLAVYYNIPTLPVDTHVTRVSNRLGFSKSKNPVIIERHLAKILCKDNWTVYHHYLILFGRYYCTAKKPKCDTCKIKDKCVMSSDKTL